MVSGFTALKIAAKERKETQKFLAKNCRAKNAKAAKEISGQRILKEAKSFEMKAFTTLTLLCCSLCAYASPTNNALVTLGETNGFGVQFALTEDESLFINWDKLILPHYTPIAVAKRGVPIFTAVIIAGAGIQNGTADVTFDAVIYKPDGSIYGKQTNMVGVQGRIDPSPKTLQLCRDYMGIRIEPKDPAGTYTANIIVRDNVKKLTLRLKRSFTVQ